MAVQLLWVMAAAMAAVLFMTALRDLPPSAPAGDEGGWASDSSSPANFGLPAAGKAHGHGKALV